MSYAQSMLPDKGFEHIVLTPSRFEHYKGVHVLIESIRFVLQEYPKTLFAIIGEGRDEAALRRLAMKLDVSENVCFLGRIEFDQMPAFYRLASICVFPSIIEESLGYVAIEAMSCGTPVIASRIGALPEIIGRHGLGGILFPPGAHVQLAREIISLISNEEARNALAQWGRSRILDTFSAEGMVSDTESLLLSLVSR
jgi:glycosyltransferase involved in cell wall biosynthesis